MNALAFVLKERLDTLLEEYERRRQTHPDYAAMPTPFRREAARRTLNLVVDWLQTGDDTRLIQFIRATAKERAAQGLDLGIVQHAVNELEAIIEPLASDLETAKLVWRTLSKARDAITQQAAETLLASEKRLRQMVDQSPSGIFHTAPAGRLLEANPAFLRITDYASMEAINQVGVPALYENPADRQRLIAMLQQGPVIGFETHFRRADGQIIAVSISLRMVQEADSEPYLEGILEDITQHKRAEEAWRASQELLQLVMDNIPQSIFWKDTDLVYRGCNRQFVEEGNFTSPDQIIGKTAYDMPWADNAELYHADDRRVIETDTPKLNIEEPLRKGDGRLGWLRTNKIPMHDAQGKVIGILSTAEDITEQKQIEAALRESRQLLQTVMDNIPQAIFWKDQNLTYLGCNCAFAADAGLASPSDAVGKTDWDMPWKEQAELYRADDSRVMESGAPKLDYEEPQTTPDGSTIWLRTSKVPLRDASGNVTAVLGMYEDITERKRAEAAVRESQQRFQGLVETLSDWIWEVDPNGAYTYVSPKVQDLLGYEPDEVLGKTPFDLMPPEEAQRVAGVFGPLLMARQPLVALENTNQHKDGRLVVLETSGAPFFDAEGQFKGYRCTDRDITERKRLEHQIQQSLARRGVQVQTSTEVAQEIAAAPALDELFRRVVTLVKERFGYYHTQLFRYEPSLDAVVLVTGYGEEGRKMLATGHKAAMGRGVVGTSAATGQSILATDVVKDKDWRPNLNLPDTQGELAVPIKLRDEVLGILDVQSAQAGALTAEDQLLLEGLCGQIAVAIEHRRAEDRLAEERNLMRTLIDTLPDLVYAKDVASRFILANTATADVMGAATPDDLIGKSDLDFYPRELAEQYWASELPILRDGIPLINHEEPNVDAAGHQKWDATTKVPLRDAQGQIIGLVGVTRDITERKQSETKLQETVRELERLYRATTREGWQAFLETGQLAPGYRYDRIAVQPAQDVWGPQIERAIQQNALVPPSPENAVAVAPLSVRGEVVGALGVYDDSQQPLSPDELTLLQEIIEQGALALENARLYQDTQRRAAREQAINEITARIRTAITLEGVLDSAVREISQVTGANYAAIDLELEEA